jgi:hypothetical protein
MRKRSTITMLAFLAIALFGAGTARADTSFSCTVTRVLDRVDVACSNTITINGDLVQFFAIAKTDAARASRWMSTAVKPSLIVTRRGEGYMVSTETPSSSETI